MPIHRSSIARYLRALSCAAVAVGLAALANPAAAQYRETPQGQRGAAKIIRIDDKGRFERCAAHFESSAGFLRIAWDRNHAYAMSVPAVPVNGMLLLRLDTPYGMHSLDAVTNGKRIAAKIDMQTIEVVLKLRGQINVIVGNRRFDYALGNASMQDIVVAVEDCVHKAMR